MRAFGCPGCGQLVFFENSACLRCGTALGFDSPTLDLVALDPAVHARCADSTTIGCNWVVPAVRAGDRCESCVLTRTRPNDDDIIGLRAWAEVEAAKRRLIHQLLDLGLPLDGLTFDLLSSAYSPVTTGHAGGVITLDLAEANAVTREQVRVELGEPYRTILGHLRHEIGHFLWLALVERTGRHEEFRAWFGDERVDYAAALRRHYECGPPVGWTASHVSAYAAAHPWEDWAETFAHLLHILDTLQTAGAYGVVMTGPRTVHQASTSAALTAMPGIGGPDRPFGQVLAEWFPLTFALNAINRSMGADDLYPFLLAERVVGKLTWVHDLARATTRPLRS